MKRLGWMLVASSAAFAGSAMPPPRLAAKVSGVASWVDEGGHAAARVELTNHTGQTCAVLHYTVGWVERTTGATHAFEVWPEKLTLAPHGHETAQVSPREWDVDRARPPDVQVRGLDCR